MTFKKAYYYFHYKIYKFFSKRENIFLSDGFRAEISLMAIKLWLVFPIYAYFGLLQEKRPTISILQPTVFLPMIVIFSSTLYFFTFSSKWKIYHEEFDKWPKNKNIKGGILVLGIIALIVVNAFLSIYLLDKKFK
jgi:hypothetical protein